MKSLASSALMAALLLGLFAPAAVALPTAVADGSLILATEAEGEDEGDEAPATTTISEGGIEPAEMAPPVVDEPSEDQWTAKFLAPLVAVLGALGVLAAFALYGLRLRARYRVVE